MQILIFVEQSRIHIMPTTIESSEYCSVGHVKYTVAQAIGRATALYNLKDQASHDDKDVKALSVSKIRFDILMSELAVRRSDLHLRVWQTPRYP